MSGQAVKRQRDIAFPVRGRRSLRCLLGFHRANYVNRNWICVRCHRYAADRRWWEVWS